MKNSDLRYWLALRFIEDLGNVGYKNLVDVFSSPQAIFEASLPALMKIPRIGEKTAAAIAGFNNWDIVDRELERADKLQVAIVPFKDQRYPTILLNMYDPPALLYIKGEIAPDDIHVAIVGSRDASSYGVFTAEKLSRELALQGITVVSGLARGIDSAAHKGTLSGRGKTVAVLGSGLDVIYPAENKDLFHAIASSGAVISEYPFSTPPRGTNFPARNRIISGLSLGVVVVEAHNRSGSLITARLALEQGKDVFAVPGSIDSPGSQGTHRLIKQGAKLVETIDDILEEIQPQIDRPVPDLLPLKPATAPDICSSRKNSFEQMQPQEASVFRILGKTPLHIDSIIEKTALQPNEVLTLLLSLELQGRVAQLPGKRFITKE